LKKKSYKEHPNLHKEDWRLQAVTTITKDAKLFTGREVKKGDTVKKYIQVNFNKGSLGFGVPNSIALLLNLSHKLFQESKSQFNNLPINRSSKLIQDIDEDKEIFDFYETFFASIILSYTSIESFANEYIPDNYIYERTIKGQKEFLNKQDIERKLPLDEKLLRILPKEMGVKFSTRSNRGPIYKSLKNKRDRIIHMKSKDRYPDPKKFPKLQQKRLSDNIWNALISDPLFDGHEIALDIISHFVGSLSDEKQPRWFKKYPNR
jgi:hypothetical protein